MVLVLVCREGRNGWAFCLKKAVHIRHQKKQIKLSKETLIRREILITSSDRCPPFAGGEALIERG
jgi:hypothetical protein